MSVNRFRFVSPGIFLNEIDQSQLPREFEDIGPVVVGRSVKGPMMRPVKVQSRLEFEELFGAPIVGGANVDVWREGNQTAPTYGAFAAEAYLKNAGPLTFVRLGGFKNPEAGTSKETGAAGWKTTNSLNATLNQNGGAFALYVAPIASNTIDASNQTASLAAIIYVDEGTVQLSGTLLSGTGAEQVAGAWIRSSDAASKEFKIVVTDKSGNVKSKFVNFDENSKLFIRNVLNTNPTKTNDSITTTTEEYWVGETFETAIANLATSNTAFAGIIVGLKNGTVDASNFLKSAEVASSGWVIAQDKEATTSWGFGADGDFTAASKPQKLFKFHTLSEDEWAKNNVKISIQDIKVPPNQYVKFGTFSVVIRSMQDTDDQPIVLERFDLCDLDPSSPNYIAKKIGDVYTTWDYVNKRFKELGQYSNKSKFIRVEMNPDVDAGVTDQDLLPFGFYGPLTYRPVVVSSSAGVAATMPATGLLNVGFNGVSSSSGIIGNAAFTASFVSPSLPTVNNTGSYYLNDVSRIYWGIKTTKSTGKLFNKEVPEYLRTLPAGLSETDPAVKYSFVFSLDDVSASFSSGRPTAASWTPGNRATAAAYTANLTGSSNLSTFLNGINKFTMPLVGGFEGLDITEKEPFNNRTGGPLRSTATETNSYALNSIAVAIDSVSDPEVVEMNTLVVPGIKNASIHAKMVNACETRGDALAIIDIQGDYTPNTEDTRTEANRKPDVSTAVTYVKETLALNSSYGCTFYPWVLAKDLNSPNTVWLPPSVVALGTFGSTKRFSEVWFAPAGFTRGGLSESQAGGLPVLRVSQRLNTKERDSLYEANINPIVSFPAEGIVVFGQKTLQVTPSALDRINVRRLMIYLKKEVSRFASTLLFDQNVQATWNRFLSQVNPFLASVQARLGLSEFKVILDETTTTPELVDRNILYAKILLKPARAIEFIALDFVITNTGASFND